MSILTWDADPTQSIRIPTLDIVGDFYIEVKLTMTEPILDDCVVIGDDANASWLRIENDHAVKMKYDGGTKGSAVNVWPNDGLEHVLHVSRVGALHTVLVDTVSVYDTNSARTTDVQYHVIGEKEGDNQFAGIMRDLDINGVRYYAIDDGWAADPVITDSVGGQHGTALNFTSDMWSGGEPVVPKLRRILLNIMYGNTGTPTPPEPPEGGEGAEAWILNRFDGATQVTGHFDDRTSIYTHTLINNATGTILNDEKHVFDFLENTGHADKGIGIMNTTLGQMTSFSQYGSNIVIRDGVEEVFMFNVTLAPGWMDWVDYDTTNYDAIDCDEPINLYVQDLFISDWNADAALDMKAQHAEIANLQITGGGHRSLRIWTTGDVFLMDSSIENDTGDDMLWFGEDAKIAGNLYIWNCDFEGSSTCPVERIGDDGPGTPNITYLTEDPRLPGSPHYPLHPMFDLPS